MKQTNTEQQTRKPIVYIYLDIDNYITQCIKAGEFWDCESDYNSVDDDGQEIYQTQVRVITDGYSLIGSGLILPTYY